ncbi:unnamed protein product, partial [Polarella glacialis]
GGAVHRSQERRSAGESLPGDSREAKRRRRAQVEPLSGLHSNGVSRLAIAAEEEPQAASSEAQAEQLDDAEDRELDDAEDVRGGVRFRQRWRRPSSHSILRWPLFVVACFVIAVVLILYFATRALIHGFEWLFASSQTRRARMSMERADSFEAYQSAAAALDEANDLTAWKARASSRWYASSILSSALQELFEAKSARDWPRLLRALQHSLREVNFAGHLTEVLYAKSFTGTKHLVEDYRSAVVDGLDALRAELESAAEGSEETSQLAEKARRFSEFAVCTFGRSALCLSGGGAMAFQHFGVLDALLHAGLLPKIISGTSGGAAVASYICCRTDDELLGKVRRGKYPLKLDPAEIQPTITLWE